MHQTISERWNRISLRTKITGVTVLMLTLGLLVSGIGTAAMLRSYVEEQTKGKLEAIASGDMMKYFTDEGEEANAGTDLDDLGFRPTDDVFVALYDDRTGEFVNHNWRDRPRSELPAWPATLTAATVNAKNAGGYQVFTLPDDAGNPTFRAVAALMTADQHGNYAPIIIAISSKDTERLLAVYLTIFLGFGLGVVLIGALLTRMLVTSTFMPLREVERTAAAIADGDFSQRLGGATPNTEVGRLNRSLNTMLNRIDRAFRDRARTIEQMRRFVGDASHELRTPLVSVRGYAELYRMGALQTSDEVAQAMDRIEKEAIRMGGLVEDLLALARLDEAKPLELAEVDLVPLARDAALDAMAANPGRTITVIAPEEPSAAVAASSPSPDLEVELELEADRPVTGAISFAGATLARLRGRRLRGEALTPSASRRGSGPRAGAAASGSRRGQSAKARASASDAAVTTVAAMDPQESPSTATVTAPATAPVRRAVVLAEENKIRQVITNLMANAIRFTTDSSPLEIRVSIDDAAERAMVEVVDHGDGIPPQIREKIFQRFWRADTSRTRETGGSGLGLAIVSSIVAAHNGAVDVVETAGGGATFRVSLPLAGSSAAPQPISAG
ncbi:HAMP domain-containing sensor histidine kinase [Agromyces sp. Soil535]|uniref:sensor histidine kinase n=1 Tax=Agromyces sp. Soil535 TaxID=1736390 RepID=UPI0006FE1464|nr:HAMP domain-containing sensor histidine kinase [Agromyces sp. Soil535]KRE21229.1 histidine kinase [Agromyces sp. Soil535]